ncbi:MAG: hypothetical protein D6706_15955 [Chloroflexi bacterium]|nr:MAG: hypothetical protein D6706_15955 [Chloroflexota bacterium]
MNENIIDSNKPNAGRIYDYLLGGHHNFEVDRQAGEQLKQMLPFLPSALRLQRWCLQDIAEELTNRGYDLIIDFASGLPTEDHIHHRVPLETTVIYSDVDPITVAYGQEILEGTPNAHIFQANATNPEELLSRPEVQELLQGRRDVAFVMWGVSAFLPEEGIQRACQYLYDWSDEKACLVFMAQATDLNPDDPVQRKVQGMYERMGAPLAARSLERYMELVKPWRPDNNGFVSLLDWHGVDPSQMSESDRKVWGKSGPGYGAYLVK